MTAVALAKWSTVALMALGLIGNLIISLSRPATGEGKGARVAGVVIGMIIRAWIIIAICVWWQA